MKTTFRGRLGDELAGIHPELGAIFVADKSDLRDSINRRLSEGSEDKSTWDNILERHASRKVFPQTVRNAVDRLGWEESFYKSIEDATDSLLLGRRATVDALSNQIKAVKEGLDEQINSPPPKV